MFYYLKHSDGMYTQCSINDNGDVYILHTILVQRGMGNQKVKELLIVGVPKSNIEHYLDRIDGVIIGRNTRVDESQLKVLDS